MLPVRNPEDTQEFARQGEKEGKSQRTEEHRKKTSESK